MRFRLAIFLVLAALLAAAALIGVAAYRTSQDAGEVAPTSPATTTAPAVEQAEQTPRQPEPPRVQAYSDLLRVLPGMADASIGTEKLPLEQAARIRLPCWAYICPRRDLWISHPEAPSLANLTDESRRAVHLTREQVVHVYWQRAGRQYRPLPVVRDQSGEFRMLISPGQFVKLEHQDYHWTFAVPLEDGLAVPTSRGVSLIRPGADPVEQHRQLADSSMSVPMIEPTRNGFLAWIPSSRPEIKAKVAWFSDGQWQSLPGTWDLPFVQLVPFVDGSVLQIIPEAMGIVRLQIAELEATPTDESRLKHLVAQLSDDDPELRNQAHAQLAAMGPAAWSTLEQMLQQTTGEARLRVEEILRSRTSPSLGRFELIDGMLRPIWRINDGMVYLAEAGVKVQSGGHENQATPAWIAIRRGRPIQLLPPALARKLAVGSVELYCVGGEWVVSDSLSGAQLFFGQELLPLTRQAQMDYRVLAGIDRQSRVLLAPVGAEPYGKDFLLIDPRIADPTLTLQIWTMPVPGGEVGWTEDHWPAVKRGGAFALKENAWSAVKGELLTSLAPELTSSSTSQPLSRIPGKITDGSTVWIDTSMLAMRDSAGRLHEQPISEQAPGAILAGAVKNDRVYLLHAEGTISRYRVNPVGPQPFSLDAVFPEVVRQTGEVLRMWIDPAGRICIATAQPMLVVIFADMKIPPAIMDLIPAGELKQARPE